ncbi:hypothetical protein HUK80_10050 [Flavobacterium sp. MAH-1]|uniref:Tail specific protease domain-containing protein n=1 Tax=Flavobacterium agri TaxID=2743471 RepID=A0A7Y8Y299_9FLAO|nr:S41 family peptidase [Flavobacterium agri]NUY81237.1 hypothetical protein [Flavobacterium agri]NYA71261.1 hypothetical protein [Flavobacterium agri]
MKRIILTGIAMLCLGVTAQTPITESDKKETLAKLGRTLNEKYYSAELGKQLNTYLDKRTKSGAYDHILSGEHFASQLTSELQQQVNDKHIRVEYHPETLPPDDRAEIMSIPESEKVGYGNMLRHINYGIRKVEVLRGNIGYIDFESFVDPEFASETYVGMMAYLSHTEALIIDLRQCGGSYSPKAVPFLMSYFFNDPVKLEETYWRKTNSTTQAWTAAVVPGQKYLNKPIYVLTSHATFSGAEAFVNGMKKYKRATIIGQPTGGGSHAGGIVRLSDHFQAYISVGKIIANNEHDLSDWESQGITPDVVVNTKLALNLAQQLAMKNSIATTDEDVWRNALQQWIKEVEDEKPVLKTVTFELKGFNQAKEVKLAGTFNDWTQTGMQKLKKGWSATVESETGKQRYKFIVDGKWIVDPDNPDTVNIQGNTDSVIEVN